jgi:hypothetical protein
MTQLHTVHRGLGVFRATNDVDIVLHIETSRGVSDKTATVLEALGYRLMDRVDPRAEVAHRFIRGRDHVDIVTARGPADVVDVLMADHPAPAAVHKLRHRTMVRIEGGTQALRRTINSRAFGAVILKAAAYTADTRERERHLFDAT